MACSLFTASCKKEDNEMSKTFKGPEVQVHNGKAWTLLTTDQAGNPAKLAVVIDDAAMNSLPTAGHDHPGHDHSGTNNWILKLHPKAAGSIFDHVGLDWNPAGHEPDPIYGKPHFDFHFYMISITAVAAIPPYEVDSVKFKNSPGVDYLPAGYFNAGGGVPQMGAHWVDPTSGEFNGQPFGQTFLYGSFDGKVTFAEPMITLDFIRSHSTFERTIPQSKKVQKSGYYPTVMKILKHDGVTEILLDGFVYRAQS